METVMSRLLNSRGTKRKTSSTKLTRVSPFRALRAVKRPLSSPSTISQKSALRKKMTPKTSKAKGRRLQNWVADKLLSVFKALTSLDVRSTPMGVNGVDVQLSTAAFKKFPYDIECKNTERTKTIYNYYEQAISHNNKGEPLLIIKMNRQRPLAIMDAEHFIEIVSCKSLK
tara:strand:- start:498 stop:1010 length:513 start_codon:yes stop_codon:yes gene_type:complete